MATPYRSYLGGASAVVHSRVIRERIFDLAAEAACRFTARLLDRGVEVYSPIAHSHYVAKHVTVAGAESDYWLERQWPIMNAAKGIIVAKLPGWDVSSGIRHEREFFQHREKPEVLLDENFTDLPGILKCQ